MATCLDNGLVTRAGRNMALSQNARFSVDIISDQTIEHPLGGSIARMLMAGLATRGWEVSDVDNWRDSGWSFTCGRRTLNLQVVLAGTVDSSEWLVQIVPTFVPGVLGRLFGRRASASTALIFAVAQDVHSILLEEGGRDFKWCWDGYPEEETSTPQPVEADS